MAGRDLPNVGLTAFFALGEDGWKTAMDKNLLLLSVLVQGVVTSKESTTPVSPVDGDVYLFDETHPTNPNVVAIRDSGAWVFATPARGWSVYNQDTDTQLTFNGSAWA